MTDRLCTACEAYAIQRFPATAGGHRFIVPACLVLLLCALPFIWS